MFIGDFTPPPFKQRLWRWSDRGLELSSTTSCMHPHHHHKCTCSCTYVSRCLLAHFGRCSLHNINTNYSINMASSLQLAMAMGYRPPLSTIRYPAKPQPIAVNTAIAHCTAKISISAALHHDNLQPFRILHREHLQPFHRRIDILPPTTSNISKHQI